MVISWEDDNKDFIKNQQEIFKTAYDIASRKLDRNKRNIMTNVKLRKHQISQHLALRFW